MKGLQDAIEKLEIANSEHQRALKRLARLRNRAKIATANIANASAMIASSGEALTEQSQTAAEQAVALASARGLEIAADLSALADKAKDRTDEFRTLSVEDICAQIETNIDAFATGLQDTITKHLDHVVAGHLPDFEERIDAKFNDLGVKLESAKTNLKGQATEWSADLSELREITTDSISAIEETDLTVEWEAVRERLAETLVGRFTEIADRIDNLVTEVDKALNDIQTLVEGFSSARQVTNQGVDTSSTGLEAVTSILIDIKSILEAVK